MNYLSGFLGSKTKLLSSTWGELLIESASFTPAIDGDLVIHIGRPLEESNPLIRIHSLCVFSEIFDSEICDCKEQLQLALTRLTLEGHGLLFYLRFDGRGAGLAAKVKATALELEGLDTYNSRLAVGVAPEGRDFSLIGKYLYDRNLSQVRLMTNNPLKINALKNEGINVIREPLIVTNPNEKVRELLQTKAKKFHHDLPDFM